MTSRKEEEWYKKFQKGSFVVKGWKARTKEILKPFSSPEKEGLNVKLDKLGEQIGREWSRSNSIRRIDTPMLQKWGNELLAAKKGGVDALLNKIEKLEADIEVLLS